MAPTRFSSGPSLWSFSFPLRVGYRACLYGRVSYPISIPACPAVNSEGRRESKKPTGNQREKIDGKERGSLLSAPANTGSHSEPPSHCQSPVPSPAERSHPVLSVSALDDGSPVRLRLRA